MHVAPELPPPAADALAHSAALSAVIRRRIADRGGWIDFSEYMDLALYAPGLGYYSAGARKFGVAGDFVTAPEVSPLFARCIARAVAPVIARGSGNDILELGAGTGAMAADILQTLARDDVLPAHYRILEVSADLRERQRWTLRERAAEYLPLVEWLDELPVNFDGAIIANEVVDALPVTRFRIGDARERVQALGVAIDGDGFRWVARAAGAELCAAIDAIEADLGGGLPARYESEINLRLRGWIGGLGAALRDGICVLIDYGLASREFYAPDRSNGTLICHYRHRAHVDPFRWPGLQDITAWVDFSAVAAAATAAGLEVAGFTSQAEFLIAAGIEAEFVAAGKVSGDQRAHLNLSREMQVLLLPGEMGEKFKVMWFGRGGAQLDAVFASHDDRHRL